MIRKDRLQKTIEEVQREIPQKLVAAASKTLSAIKANNHDWTFLDEVLFWQHTQIAYLYGRSDSIKRFAA